MVKPGDMLKVVSDLGTDSKTFPFGVNEAMLRFAGKFVKARTVETTQVYSRGDLIKTLLITIYDDGGQFSWSIPMFDIDEPFIKKIKLKGLI